MYKLKPCPFCGGEAEIEHQYIFGREYSMVKCKECGAETLPILISFTYSSDERATEAWNRR